MVDLGEVEEKSDMMSALADWGFDVGVGARKSRSNRLDGAAGAGAAVGTDGAGADTGAGAGAGAGVTVGCAEPPIRSTGAALRESNG